MSCGLVSLAPGPVALETEQRSQNFSNIRNTFEGSRGKQSPPPTPARRQLTRVSKSRSPTPPRVSYETKPRSNSARQPRTPEPLRNTSPSFSRQSSSQSQSMQNGRSDLVFALSKQDPVMCRSPSPYLLPPEEELNFDLIHVNSAKLSHPTKTRVPRRSHRSRRPPSPKLRTQLSFLEDKFSTQPVLFL
jgi:hypothetical protein